MIDPRTNPISRTMYLRTQQPTNPNSRFLPWQAMPTTRCIPMDRWMHRVAVQHVTTGAARSIKGAHCRPTIYCAQNKRAWWYGSTIPAVEVGGGFSHSRLRRAICSLLPLPPRPHPPGLLCAIGTPPHVCRSTLAHGDRGPEQNPTYVLYFVPGFRPNCPLRSRS